MQKTMYNEKCAEVALWNFKDWVFKCIQKAGGEIAVVFEYDADTGKMIAHCSDGITIKQSVCSTAITVTWGSGHVSILKG